jgi:hypothetical protein
MKIKCLDNLNNSSADVVIVTAPWTDSQIPLMAPAVLKPIVEKTGLSCLAVDLNAEVYNNLKIYADINNQNINEYIKFFFDDPCVITPQVQEYMFDLLQTVATQIMSWNPTYVGISVFSYVNRNFTRWLCYFIKKINPSVKIILGGAGCLEQFTGPAFFADELIAKSLADYHIRGDGEQALYELLTGNDSYSGINDSLWTQLSNQELSKLPIPDYSNYNFDEYDKHVLCLQGSRGCVRACKFCDYIENWTKFSWRTADDIFNEMITQFKKHKITTFKFQDTLTNGNVKEFNRLLEILADYNKQNPKQSFKWGGYYIFREQTLSDDYLWKKLHESGAVILTVGIESLDEGIRYDIGKKFTNNSIDYHLEKALEHNIGLQLLFITGYVNETYEHIQYRKKWLDEHVKFQPIISGIQWGGGLGIFPNTFLDRNKDKLEIQFIGKNPHEWVNLKTGSTPNIRSKWIVELNEYSERLGYKVLKNIDNHFLLEQQLNEKI